MILSKRALFLLVIAMLACIPLIAMLPEAIAHALLKEHGVMETIAAVLPLITGMILLWRFGKNPDAMMACFILWLAAYRESTLHWHKQFFTMNIGSLWDYFDPSFGLDQKIAAVIVLLPVFVVLALLLWRNGFLVWEQIKQRNISAQALSIGVCFLIFSQIAEHIHKRFFWEVDVIGILLFSTEEVLETAAQILFLLAAIGAGGKKWDT